MGGVDLKDTRLYSYLAEGRTMKWKTSLLFIIRSCCSKQLHYILCKENTSAVRILIRHEYRIALVQSLVKDYRPQKSPVVRRTQEQVRQARARQDDIRPPMHIVVFRPNCHNVRNLPNGARRNCVGGHAKRIRTV